MAERRALVMDEWGLVVKEEGVSGTGGSDIFALERRASGALERSGKAPEARSGRAKISDEKSPPGGAGLAARPGVFGAAFMPLFSAPFASPLRAVFARKSSPVSSRRMSRAAATRCSRKTTAPALR